MTELAVVDTTTGEITARETGPLASLRNARAMLGSASSLDEVKQIRDKAEALKHYVEAAGMGLAMQNQCADIKLRAERKAGEMLAEMPKNPGGRSTASTLPEVGINHTQSSRWQRIASLPEDVFESYVADTTAANRELTTAGALQLARFVKAQDVTDHPLLGNSPDGRGLVGLTGTFRTIIADPPWQYGNGGTRNAAAKHYPTMTIEDLCSLDVEAHSAVDAHLYLWTTTSFLREAFDVMEAWGFTYKTNLVWAKTAFGLGNYFRVSHEHVLFGTRGSLPIPAADRVKSWFVSDRGKHSSKPDVFLDLVDKCSPGPGLEMFARSDGRDVRMSSVIDWTYWGNAA